MAKFIKNHLACGEGWPEQRAADGGGAGDGGRCDHHGHAHDGGRGTVDPPRGQGKGRGRGWQ